MTARFDIDWVRAHAEGRLTSSERAEFEARLRREPHLVELVDRYAEVATWPLEPVAASTVRFEDLPLDTPAVDDASRRWPMHRLAIAAGILVAFGGGVFALSRTGPSSPDRSADGSSGPVVLAAVEAASVRSAPLPDAVPIPTAAEEYVPVVDRKLHFVRGVDAGRSVARVADRPTIVFVHLDGCPACAQLERTTFRDSRVLDAAAGYVFAEVSAKVVRSGLQVPSDLGLENVQAWPLFAVFDASGAQVDAFGGVLDAEAFVARLARAVPTAGKPADWSTIHEAARRVRSSDAATTEGAKAVELANVETATLPSALADAVTRRRAEVQASARGALEAAAALVAENRVDDAVAELDRRAPRFAGSPFESDLRRVRDRLARDRKFPPLEYAR